MGKSMRTLIIASIAIILVAPAVSGPGDIYYVDTLQAEIREGPSSDSEIKFIIAIGRKLVEFDRENGWIHVGVDKTGGKDGWIEASKVSKTDPDGLKY